MSLPSVLNSHVRLLVTQMKLLKVMYSLLGFTLFLTVCYRLLADGLVEGVLLEGASATSESAGKNSRPLSRN